MDFYENVEDEYTKAWKNARNEVHERYLFCRQAVPVLHAVLHDLSAAFDLADTIFDENERRAKAAMEAIESIKERK